MIQLHLTTMIKISSPDSALAASMIIVTEKSCVMQDVFVAL
jgi:hypothetical protein